MLLLSLVCVLLARNALSLLLASRVLLAGGIDSHAACLHLLAYGRLVLHLIYLAATDVLIQGLHSFRNEL